MNTNLAHALAALHAAGETAAHNEPIHRNAGDHNQANLDLAVATECREALALLEALTATPRVLFVALHDSYKTVVVLGGKLVTHRRSILFDDGRSGAVQDGTIYDDFDKANLDYGTHKDLLDAIDRGDHHDAAHALRKLHGLTPDH